MATIINTPGTTTEDSSSSAMEFLMAIVLILIIAAIALYFGPALLRGVIGPTQVNIPDKVDVNIKSQ